MRLAVQIFLKAGQSFRFTCDSIEIERTPDGQKITDIRWVNASPGIRYLHGDNIAAILNWAEADPDPHSQWELGL